MQTKNLEGAEALRNNLRKPGAKDAMMVEEDGEGELERRGEEEGEVVLRAWYEIINSTTRFP